MELSVGVIKRATVEASMTMVASFDLCVDGVVVFLCVKLTTL
jgi:hypothetical protein